MKSKLLLFTFFSAASFLNAQSVQKEGFPTKLETKNNIKFSGQSHHPAVNSSREIITIWENDFSVPSNWVSSSEGVGTDAWVIGTAGPAGSFPIPPIESTTAANNFALFDSDLLCSGNQIVNLTSTEIIDLSAHPAVVLQFQQNYRRFSDSTFVFVSNDAGANWVKYPVNVNLSNNDNSAGNPETVSVNISATAASQATVQIRFQFYSPSSLAANAGCAYAWMVDDVKIVTVSEFELVVTSAYYGDPVTDFEYGTYPLTQAQPVTIGATVLNQGTADQQFNLEYQILRDGIEVNSGVTPTPFLVTSFAPAQGYFFTTAYTPDAVGIYTVNVQVTSANVEEDPTNNSGTKEFEVSEFIYSGLNSNDLVGANTQLGAGSTTVAFKIGHQYKIVNTAQIKAIDIAVSSESTVNTEVEVELFNSNDLSTALGTQIFDITATHPTTFQIFTVEFDGEITLDAGTAGGELYAAVMGVSNPENAFFFYSNPEDEDDASLLYGPFGANSAIDWFLGGETPLINLNFDLSTGIEDVNADTDALSVYPNPASSNMSVKLNMSKASSFIISLVDMNGKVVFNKAVNGKILGYQDTIDLGIYANGIYNLQVVSSNGTTTQKVVVAH